MNRRAMVVLLALAGNSLLGGWLLGAAPAVAGDVGWIEDYALATDRDVPLKQLIPGSGRLLLLHLPPLSGP